MTGLLDIGLIAQAFVIIFLSHQAMTEEEWGFSFQYRHHRHFFSLRISMDYRTGELPIPGASLGFPWLHLYFIYEDELELPSTFSAPPNVHMMQAGNNTLWADFDVGEGQGTVSIVFVSEQRIRATATFLK